jgi:hypothetical protein
MGNIAVIGPRSSGKTSYLAALAQWSVLGQGLYQQKFDVQAIGEDAEKLSEKAEAIIRQGASLDPTEMHGGVYSMPTYQFRIEIKQWFQKPETIDLVVKDYAGEIFEALASGNLTSSQESFINDCIRDDIAGCLILVTEWQKGTDGFYERVMQNFLRQMDRQLDENSRKEPFRLAVAMSKCERGELWPGRLEPEVDLFETYLPRMTALLRKRLTPESLRFYALSTFGVLDRNDPRPNRVDEMGREGKNSVLRATSVWRPYGMLGPLYWLSKGKRVRGNV